MLKLEPKKVWEHFENLCKIPRPSGHEKAAGEYVVSVAKAHKLEWERDAVGNVVIRVPASKGREKAPVTVLQGHTDMVCEKNSDVKHDFLRDPIRPRLVGDVVKATGTTLGADNGIGVAMALAILDEKAAVHGPLELLFTIDEETGLNGANGLQPGFVKGRRLLNLDTEEDGQLYVGCAGGKDTVLTLPLSREKSADPRPAYLLSVKGLRGGHSGGDIHEGRGNANRILARALDALAQAGAGFSLVSVQGGSKRNAIPREAFALLHADAAAARKAGAALKTLEATVRAELKGVDEGVALTLAKTKSQGPALTAPSQRKVLNLLASVPHGLISYSRQIHGLVETSTNFAIVETRPAAMDVITSQRSSVESQRDWAAWWVGSVGRLAGAKVRHSNGYPGWEPNMDSPILAQARKTYKRLFREDPKVKAIHAGLECGIIGGKYPGMDMVSLGPTIRNAHSPDEEVHVASVARTYKYLLELLKDLA
ncbi:MAG: aminoacyl-histidine dipeptidase [Acidobacteriota bacterium]